MQRALVERAVAEHKSMAQLIREAVAAYLARPAGIGGEDSMTAGSSAWERDPLSSIGSSPTPADVTDGSGNHDRYLYLGLGSQADDT